MRIRLIIPILMLLMNSRGYSQNESDNSKGVVQTSLGFGGGLDYGGFGVNFLIYPHNHVGIFAGVGYAIAGVGSNVGVKVKIGASSRYTPYVMGMYGYNAAIYLSNASRYDRIFYGPSFGIGVDLPPRSSGSYWTLAILLPLRNAEVNSYIDNLKSSGVSFSNNLLPIAISVGRRIAINKRSK